MTMPIPPTIRDAAPGEDDALLALTLAAYDEYAAAFPPAFWAGYRRNIVEQFDGGATAQRIVAVRDGALVGSVLLFPPASRDDGNGADSPPDGDGTGKPPDEGETSAPAAPEIRLLAVATAARGQGVGALLLGECVRRARAAGAPALGLHSMEVMTVAIRMYERVGFVRDPRTDFRPVPEVLVKGYRLDLVSNNTSGSCFK